MLRSLIRESRCQDADYFFGKWKEVIFWLIKHLYPILPLCNSFPAAHSASWLYFSEVQARGHYYPDPIYSKLWLREKGLCSHVRLGSLGAVVKRTNKWQVTIMKWVIYTDHMCGVQRRPGLSVQLRVPTPWTQSKQITCMAYNVQFIFLRLLHTDDKRILK